MTGGGNGRASNFAIALTHDANNRLEQLAGEAGLSKSKLAAYLLEELLPTVKGVKTRLQITREPVAR